MDYLAVGAIRYMARPKRRRLRCIPLINGGDQLQQFRGGDRILSITFPELAMTAADFFKAAGPQQLRRLIQKS